MGHKITDNVPLLHMVSLGMLETPPHQEPFGRTKTNT